MLRCRCNNAISISRTKWEIFSWHHHPDKHVRRFSDHKVEQCVYCGRVHVCAWYSDFSWALEWDRVSVYGLNHVLLLCVCVCKKFPDKEINIKWKKEKKNFAWKQEQSDLRLWGHINKDVEPHGWYLDLCIQDYCENTTSLTTGRITFYVINLVMALGWHRL